MPARPFAGSGPPRRRACVGSSSTPAATESSFSGINPTESSSVSHGTMRSVPGMGARCSSTWLTSTASTRSCPITRVTVVDRCSGIPKVVQAVLDVAAQTVGVRHELVHALDRNPLERAAARHDKPDVARAQNDGTRAGLEVLDIDVSLRQAGRKQACGTATGNLDLAARALSAPHSKDDRASGELQHAGQGS